MRLTEQDIGMGLIIVTCKCCGNVYKSHQLANALSYSFIPNFGCDKCQGVVPKSRTIAEQDRATQTN